MDTLLDLASEDDRIELVVADLGFGLIEPFVERFPERFLNVGVAEQNMIGVATGMALTGSIVFAYSIGNFPTLRCLEQIRSDACYHGANVKIVAVGGGLAYGVLGVSHHATEDLSVMRSMPGLAVAAAGDSFEARALTRALAEMDGPGYLRLGRGGEAPVHTVGLALPPGSSVQVRDGNDIALLATGGMLGTAVEVARLMTAEGIGLRVISVPWLDPLDVEAVRRAGRECDIVVTLEDHSIRGGLGSAVAEVLAEHHPTAPLLRIGLPVAFTSIVGSQSYLLERYGLDVVSVTERLTAQWRERQGKRSTVA